jgi:Flp pilus assembly protein TadG
MLLLPVAMLMLFGIMEYCRYVMMLQVVTNAAREGCRYAVMHTDPVVLNGTTYGNATANVTSIVSNSLGGESLVGQAIAVYESDALGNNLGTWSNTSNGQWITVQITGSFKSVVAPFLMMPSSMPIAATVTMQCEGN